MTRHINKQTYYDFFTLEILKDQQLSSNAKVIMLLLLAKGVSLTEVITIIGGKEATNSGIQERTERGYIIFGEK